MIVRKNIFPALKKTMFAATAVFGLMQCNDEEMVQPTASPATVSAVSTTANTTVASLTVTGANTTYATLTDCKTCSYIVDAKEEVVDGKALGLKPGSIICLNKGVQYGNLEFINLDGTVDKPIVIASIKAHAAEVVVADEASSQDPY